jgi:hypothetical protein
MEEWSLLVCVHNVWFIVYLLCPHNFSLFHIHHNYLTQGPVCNVIYDPEFSYDRINRPGPPLPPCLPMDRVAAKTRKRIHAGGRFSYMFGLHNKTNYANLFESATDGAELVVVLPPAFTLSGIKTQSAKITARRIIDSTTAGTYVWRISGAGIKTLKKLAIKLMLSVDACEASGTETISASFYPYGREVYNCHYDLETDVRVVGSTKKCNASQGRGKHRDRTHKSSLFK